MRLRRTIVFNKNVEDKGSNLKWGQSLEDLDHLQAIANVISVNFNDIKEVYDNIEMLEESDVKLEIIERKPSIDKKKVERKVSIDSEKEKNFETQLSTTSEKLEEATETIDNSNIIAMNRKISIVDDTASKLKPPPSPAKNPVSAVLYITNLVRPFTLKQLKEMLERMGKIREDGFWTDKIKSKCYVYYETEE